MERTGTKQKNVAGPRQITTRSSSTNKETTPEKSENTTKQAARRSSRSISTSNKTERTVKTVKELEELTTRNSIKDRECLRLTFVALDTESKARAERIDHLEKALKTAMEENYLLKETLQQERIQNDIEFDRTDKEILYLKDRLRKFEDLEKDEKATNTTRELSAPNQGIIEQITKLLEPVTQKINEISATMAENESRNNNRFTRIETERTTPRRQPQDTGSEASKTNETQDPPTILHNTESFPELKPRKPTEKGTLKSYAKATKGTKANHQEPHSKPPETFRDLMKLIPIRERGPKNNWTILRNPAHQEPMTLLKTLINPRAEGINIEAINYTSNGNIRIRTGNEEDLQKLKSNNNLKKQGFQFSDPESKKPTIIIFNVETNLSKSELTEEVFDNNAIAENLTREQFGEQFIPRFLIKNAKQDSKTHWVVDVNP